MLSMINEMCSDCIHKNTCTDGYKKSVFMHYLSDHPIDHGCEEYQPSDLYLDTELKISGPQSKKCLIRRSPDGHFELPGVSWDEIPGTVYGALCKLRDYEKTGLHPDDFGATSYEKKRVYKIYYKLPEDDEMHTLYAENEDQAGKIIVMLANSGASSIVQNRWSWEVFIEK